jgi:hypothetical protein
VRWQAGAEVGLHAFLTSVYSWVGGQPHKQGRRSEGPRADWNPVVTELSRLRLC